MKRRCQAILDPGETIGALHVHTTDIYICGLPECRTPHPAEGRVLIPYLPLCGAHRAIASATEVPVYLNESIAEFRL